MQTEGRKIVWSPLPGSQVDFLACNIRECLYHGSRGGGKTDCLIMAFCQHVGKGYGENWRGLIIREHFKNLEDVIAKSRKWIPKIWPKANYVGGNKPSWTFPTGEKLFFVHANKLSDYDNYHGHEYPFVGWEELSNWATPDLYLKMFSVCRSSGPKEMPRIIRATTNPSGRGHGWVRRRFIDPVPSGEIIIDDKTGQQRIAIFSHWSENIYLTDNDPEYIKNLLENPEHLVRAWLYGDWDIIAGGMFDDVWKKEYNVVAPFTIPSSWPIERCYDQGSAHPFSVLWIAESDGCDVRWADGDWMPTCRGDLFVIAEWYGAQKDDDSKGLKMTAREIARGILEREKSMGLKNVQPGAADSELWNVKGREKTLADVMEDEGVYFQKYAKGAGSRKAGWEMMREYIKSAWSDDTGTPGLFVFETCRKLIAHIPALPRDEKDPEDVDTDSIDHDSEVARYCIMHKKSTVKTQTTKGTY